MSSTECTFSVLVFLLFRGQYSQVVPDGTSLGHALSVQVVFIIFPLFDLMEHDCLLHIVMRQGNAVFTGRASFLSDKKGLLT